MEQHIFAPGVAHLAAVSPELAAIIDRVGPCTLRFHDDRFGALVSAILSQQVSSAAARSSTASLTSAAMNSATRARREAETQTDSAAIIEGSHASE